MLLNWVNQETNWVVQEISGVEGEQWVIFDHEGVMISCEWEDSKEGCMEETDYLRSEDYYINAN